MLLFFLPSVVVLVRRLQDIQHELYTLRFGLGRLPSPNEKPNWIAQFRKKQIQQIRKEFGFDWFSFTFLDLFDYEHPYFWLFGYFFLETKNFIISFIRKGKEVAGKRCFGKHKCTFYDDKHCGKWFLFSCLYHFFDLIFILSSFFLSIIWFLQRVISIGTSHWDNPRDT